MPTALDRDALYYPRIHIRDVDWLKATLLCFPHVRRMLPLDYPTRDSSEVREFLETPGPRGEPLLADEFVYGGHVDRAQKLLKDRLTQNLDRAVSAYSREATLREYGSDADQFEIHVGKMPTLLHFLEEHGLGWRARRFGTPHWLAVNPKVGEAIMSSIAVALATDKGLDIVTDESRLHRALITQDMNDIFFDLLGDRSRQTRRPPDLVDELTQVVIRAHFDVRKLRAADIAALLNDGNDLRRFKNAIIPFAQSIPDIQNPRERDERLRAAAADVIHEWKKYRKGLGKAILESVVAGAKLEAPATFLGPLAAASIGWTKLEAGLSIALVTYSGFKIFDALKRKEDRPMKYLSAVNRKAPLIDLAIAR